MGSGLFWSCLVCLRGLALHLNACPLSHNALEIVWTATRSASGFFVQGPSVRFWCRSHGSATHRCSTGGWPSVCLALFPSRFRQDPCCPVPVLLATLHLQPACCDASAFVTPVLLLWVLLLHAYLLCRAFWSTVGGPLNPSSLEWQLPPGPFRSCGGKAMSCLSLVTVCGPYCLVRTCTAAALKPSQVCGYEQHLLD